MESETATFLLHFKERGTEPSSHQGPAREAIACPGIPAKPQPLESLLSFLESRQVDVTPRRVPYVLICHMALLALHTRNRESLSVNWPNPSLGAKMSSRGGGADSLAAKKSPVYTVQLCSEDGCVGWSRQWTAGPLGSLCLEVPCLLFIPGRWGPQSFTPMLQLRPSGALRQV
ncbi:hypothetical protein LEMLEM_LOCUS59 [Lemmus lemmus]